MMSSPDRRTPVLLTFTNESSRTIRLVLEPFGEIYAMAPRSSRTVRYWGDPVDHLSVDIRDDELKLWSQSTGFLDLEEEGKPESS